MKPLAAEHPKGLLAGFETGPDNMPPWDGRTTLALLVAITISNSVNMTKFQRNESHLFAPTKTVNGGWSLGRKDAYWLQLRSRDQKSGSISPSFNDQHLSGCGRAWKYIAFRSV